MSFHGGSSFSSNVSKSPAWISLGFSKQFASRSKPYGMSVMGRKIVLHRDTMSDELLASSDVCPHRAASLSHNGLVMDGKLKCLYHGHCISPEYAIVEKDGVVWLNWTGRRAAMSDSVQPPTFLQHINPEMRTISYSLKAPVNAMLMVENLLDYVHLSQGNVHRFAIVDRETTIENLESTSVVYKYPPLAGDSLLMTVKNSFVPDAPFTTSLEFCFQDVRTGKDLPRLFLWFSIVPHDAQTSTFNLRISRGMLRWPVWDILFKLLDVLPLAEDVDVVRHVSPCHSQNILTEGDVFLKQYRHHVQTQYPDITRYFTN